MAHLIGINSTPKNTNFTEINTSEDTCNNVFQTNSNKDEVIMTRKLNAIIF